MRTRAKKVRPAIMTGLLLLMLLLPQLALAEVPGYSIDLIPYSGVYCDGITVWASVPAAGTYYVCWDTALTANQVATISTPSAGNFSAQFVVPEAARSTSTTIHKVFLIASDNNKLAEAVFEVFPTVEMTPVKGPVGTQVGIKGYGFTASETSIPIKFRGTQVKTAAADANGSWTATHSIPNLAAGDYTFEVGPDKETDEVWIMCFTVTPEIAVSPATGVSGQMITVSGTGFASNEKAIKVTFDGEPVWENISADANGSWSAQIPVPRRAAGTYTIDASGFSTWARDVPDIEFTIETGVWVEPTEAQVGDQIAVTGSGFAASEEGIKVTFDGRILDTGTIAVDRHGSWAASFVLPTSTYGAHDIGAYGAKTQAADVKKAVLSTKAKLEVNPVEASPGDSVTLTGNGFPRNQTLTVTFANRAVQEAVQSSPDGNLSAIVTVPASPAGRLSVTASGGGAQASDDFTVKARILPTPQPVAPEEGETLRTRDISFEWGRITASNNVTITYTLDITGPGGSRRISDIGTLSYRIPEEEALPKGNYHWQVKAVDEFGNESLWSDPIPFTVSPIPTWVWVIVGLVVFTTLMTVAYREGRFKVTE